MRGKSLMEIIDNESNLLLDEVEQLLRDSGFIDCPECGEWFTDSEYDTTKGDGCKCHISVCNKVFLYSDCFYVCKTMDNVEHKHLLNHPNLICRKLNVGEIVKMGSDGELELQPNV